MLRRSYGRRSMLGRLYAKVVRERTWHGERLWYATSFDALDLYEQLRNFMVTTTTLDSKYCIIFT